MLDFAPVRRKEISVPDLCAGLTPVDLYHLTDEMVHTMLGLIAGCTDADATFLPTDSAAEDKFATALEETSIPWTLGHVIVHTTASAEEAAFLGAELARGVPPREGRSRAEVPWRTVTTLAQCQHRLAESRRMRLASLDLWPDTPHLDNAAPFRPGGPPFNAVARFVLGLFHDDNHREQIAEIVRQAGTVAA